MSENAQIALARTHALEAAHLLGALPFDRIAEAAARIVQAAVAGRAVFVAGNGGSAATASHLATDLALRAGRGEVRIRATCLGQNVALLTAVANDLGYERVFAEPLSWQGTAGDIVVLLSASGNSRNVIEAAHLARSRNMTVIGLCGFAGGQLATLCDVAIVVDASAVEVVEDVHAVIAHAIARDVGRRLVGHSADARMRQRAAVFLDRDGVINRRRDAHVRTWSDFEFLPGATEALARLRTHGLPVVVVTNQAMIERDGVDPAALAEIHRRMVGTIEDSGGRIDAIFVCPHDPRLSCSCRKPRPGLLLRAASDLDLDLAASVVVGDDARDVMAARAVGSTAVLLASPGSENGWSADPGVRTAASLSDAVDLIVTAPPTR